MDRHSSIDDENNGDFDAMDGSLEDTSTFDESVEGTNVWSTAWKVLLNIGTVSTTPPDTADKSSIYIPSQPFLTALVQIFPALYEHIKSQFGASDLQKLSTVLERALSVPVHSDSSPFIVPVGEISLTPLQESILKAVRVLQKVRLL